jgi:hypothetical protein
MKKLIVAALAVVGLSIATYAQGVRHVQGITLIGGAYGIAPGSEGTTHITGLNYSKYLRKNWILNLNGLYESGNIQTTRVKNYLFNGGVDYTVLQAGKFLYFNAGLSVLAGGETLSSSENSDKKNSLIGGMSGNVNIEMYFSDRIVLQVKAEQNYLPGSKLGHWCPAFYAGLKYCIF